MPAFLSYPHLILEPGTPPRMERLPRIRVSQIVLDHLGRGWSADEIARQYPHLTLAEIHSALAYYFDHEAEMNLAIKAELAEAVGMASVHADKPLALRLAALTLE